MLRSINGDTVNNEPNSFRFTLYWGWEFNFGTCQLSLTRNLSVIFSQELAVQNWCITSSFKGTPDSVWRDISATDKEVSKCKARLVNLRSRTPNCLFAVDSNWNVMAHGDAREGKWRGNWRVEWVTSTLHTSSKHGVSSITTADAHTSDASSRLNWRPRRFKWTRPFHRKTKSGFCACTITFLFLVTVAINISPWRFRASIPTVSPCCWDRRD